jgi:hypothetical protein
MNHLTLLSVAAVLAACLPKAGVVAAGRPDAGPPGAGGEVCGDRDVPEPHDPLAHGRHELHDVIAGTGICAWVGTVDDAQAQKALTAEGVSVDGRPESFAIFAHAHRTWVVGRDAAGSMYGAFELAERWRLDGVSVPGAPLVRHPDTTLRAVNPFLVLPVPGETNWWFRDRAFWTEYLDLLAHARMNVLDIHGMYNLRNTVFPNALLYFGRSSTHPEVGVPESERQQNLAALRDIIRLAAEWGIKVSVMSYRADLSLLGDAADWILSDVALQEYTREAVHDIATQLPGLWRLGFRIGEGGRLPAWYRDAFVAGLRGTGVHPTTRTWLVSKSDMLQLIGDNSDDFLIQAKFNGEQLAAPYAIVGGGLVNRHLTSYSYENYLDAPTPYTFVFQIRTCGTHRIFRYASYERTVRTVISQSMGGSAGFTLEPPHAFYPQRDYYHRPEDRYSEWTLRRDELLYLLFGRLSYDRSTPERVFRAALARRIGTDALWPRVQAASDIVPWIQQAMTCGFDHRDYAPELEVSTTVAQWAAPPAAVPASHCAHLGPFDDFAIASPYELAADLANGRPTTRLTPLEVASIVLADASAARQPAVSVQGPEATDVVRETEALADLGEYFAFKLRAATALAVYQRTADARYLTWARDQSAQSTAAYQRLAAATAYVLPFEDRLRMSQFGLTPFHWSQQLPRLDQEAAAIDAVESAVAATRPSFTGALPAPEALAVALRPTAPIPSMVHVGGSVSVSFAPPLPEGAKVTLLGKRFANVTDFSATPMSADDAGVFTAPLADGPGAIFAVDVEVGDAGWRLPEVRRGIPYWVDALGQSPRLK